MTTSDFRLGRASYQIKPFMQIIVRQKGDRWCVHHADKQRQFNDLILATRAAIAEAFELSKNGQAAQVIYNDKKLGPKIIWTYGRDPDPT